MPITKQEVVDLGNTLFAGTTKNSNQKLQLRARSASAMRWVFRRGGRYSDICHRVIYDINIYAPTLDALAEEMKAYALKRAAEKK